MAATISVPPEYGFVVLLALGILPPVAFLHGILVGRLRKPASVIYPNPYATPEQCKASQEAYRFNCAQRAHQNYLENFPQTMLFMLIGGLKYPRSTVGLGLGWLVFRFVYAYGYIYGPKKNGGSRQSGGAFWLCQAGLWGLTIATGLQLLSG